MSADKIIHDDSVQSEFLKKIAPKLRNVRGFLNSGDPLLSNMAMKSLGYVGGQALPFDLIGERGIDTILPPPTATKPKPKPKPKGKKEAKKKSGAKKKGTGSSTPKVGKKSCGGKKASKSVTKKPVATKKPKSKSVTIPESVW